MARTVDPRSGPFAVSPRHPAYIPFWIAMAINAVGVLSGLTGADWPPVWVSSVSLALMVTFAVTARVGNARARRELRREHAGTPGADEASEQETC